MPGFLVLCVRIQSDRGHKVCNSGPYKYVRHPGYIGFVVQGFAEAILLQSSWTAALAFMRTTLLVVRSVKEEQFLMANLPGYTEYAAQVRALPVGAVCLVRTSVCLAASCHPTYISGSLFALDGRHLFHLQ